MIITSKSRISFLWIVLATLPWVAVIFKDKVMGIAFQFSMRKFVENPAALTFLLTLPWYISWIVPPVVNFMADRIWTRWGRRKPFIVIAWIGTITSIAVMPLAPNFWWLLGAYMVFSVFNDLGSPVESLKMEIVPPAQRATSQAVLSWIAQVAVLVFWVVAIGRFDEMTTMFGLPISGEQGLFWSVSIGMVVMLMFLMLGIKETNPHSKLLHERFSFKSVFGGLFSKHLWPVYILAFSVAILGSGLGAFNQLLITEQWGYTKQDQGTNIAVGGIINLMLIPMLGLLANKVGRGRVYVGLVIAGIIVNLGMYLYYNFVLFDARPTLVEMIVFGEMLSVIGILTGMALTPFVYDFIPRNELGTYAAGSGLVTRGTGILTANLMGLFVWGYASMFLGPPGEMVRVTLRDDTPKVTVQNAILAAPWVEPATGAPAVAPKLTAQPWYATGAQLDHGRGYEIRFQDHDSTSIRQQRDLLEEKRTAVRALKSYASNRYRELTNQAPATSPATTLAATASAPAPLTSVSPRFAADLIDAATKSIATRQAAAANLAKAEKYAADFEAQRLGEEMLTAGIKQLDVILDARARVFRDQVASVLGPKLLTDGEQVLSAKLEPAVVATFPLNSRPHGSAVEKTIDALHRDEPAIIDLRVVSQGEGFALSLSARAPAAELSAIAERLQKALTVAAAPGLQKAMPWPPAIPNLNTAEAIQLDLRILEDPLDRHPSPITTAVNKIESIAIDTGTPERRLNALGRNLRRPGFIEHVHASLVPKDDNAVRLTAIVDSAPSDAPVRKAPDVVVARLATLLPESSVDKAGMLYAMAIPAAKEQRMTIAQPILTTGFAKQQYDYLAGYVAVFVLQLIGLGITFLFLFLVKIGWVRRSGAEEAEAVR